MVSIWFNERFAEISVQPTNTTETQEEKKRTEKKATTNKMTVLRYIKMKRSNRIVERRERLFICLVL